MNPWLDIRLDDYEAHMAMPGIAQAQMLARLLAKSAADCAAESIALLGAAGGNGLAALDPGIVKRVVAVDINPSFIAETKARFTSRFETFDSHCCDIDEGLPRFAPVDLVFAGLILEYIDYPRFLEALPKILKPRGMFVAVLQMPSPGLPEVSDSPYRSLLILESAFRFVSPNDIQSKLEEMGLQTNEVNRIQLASGKEFSLVKGSTH